MRSNDNNTTLLGKDDMVTYKIMTDLHIRTTKNCPWNITRHKVFVRDCYVCQYCHKDTMTPYCDHVVERTYLPLSLRAWLDKDNLVTACLSCHTIKTKLYKNASEQDNNSLVKEIGNNAPMDILNKESILNTVRSHLKRKNILW